MQSDRAPIRVRGLAIPSLLLSLLAEGRWKHPGDAALARVMPWFEDPLHFLTSAPAMVRESSSLDYFTEDDATAQLFRQARGSEQAEAVDLPWLDVERAFFVAVNENAGDDVAIAFDYRTDPADPRVVASDFWTAPGRCSWREVAPTFSALVVAFDL
ncbi:hypothetical protein [Paractinoplanes durhamensis]|uniref:SMI1/KNR4 family protein n=1 Tax=Paractinoplanes durhamensis TaxID=113563 RepID=A0ABQ3YWB5_9ACTN|nr:hypothetical protein [Actinoplanes durhamensis]GIE01838.1 hypothetical protein Adu01nite_31880 [Actinoplanes durhamensis]